MSSLGMHNKNLELIVSVIKSCRTERRSRFSHQSLVPRDGLGTGMTE